MRRGGGLGALTLALVLVPALAAGQAAAPSSDVPLPPVKPVPAAVTDSELPFGETNAAATVGAEAVETPVVGEPAQAPSSAVLLGDPALAAGLSDWLTGRDAATAGGDAPAGAAGPETGGPEIREESPSVAAVAAQPSAGDGDDGAALPGPEAIADATAEDAVATDSELGAPGFEMQPPLPVPARPSLVWDDGPLDAAGAVRLFEVACLETLPDFAGVGAFFDALGFVTVPGMRMRNHPSKQVSALATTPRDVMESGVRSCAILVDGLAQAEAARAVEALVAERFAGARRFDTPARGIAHAVWTVDTILGQAKITVTESEGSTFVGATVLPPPAPPLAPGGSAS